MYKGQFAGVVGIDLPLNYFNNLVQKIEFLDGSQTFFISNQGTIISHEYGEIIGDNITEILENREFDINSLINVGKRFAFIKTVATRRTIIFVFHLFMQEIQILLELWIGFSQKLIFLKVTKYCSTQ